MIKCLNNFANRDSAFQAFQTIPRFCDSAILRFSDSSDSAKIQRFCDSSDSSDSAIQAIQQKKTK